MKRTGSADRGNECTPSSNHSAGEIQRGSRRGSQRPRRRGMRIGALVTAGAIVATGLLVYHQPFGPFFGASNPASDSSEIETVEASEGIVRVTIESPGVVEPYRTRTLRSAIDGTVTWMAEEGSEVADGSPLVRFNARELERAVQRAEIAVGDGRLKRDRAAEELTRAQRVLAEREALLVSGSVSRDEVETAREHAGTAEYNLRSADLALERAGIDLEEAEEALAGAVLSAPFDGTVLRTEASEGDRIGRNSTLLTFGDLARLRFSAEIDEYDIGNITKGLPVGIVSDLLGPENIRARVTGMSPEAEIVNNIPVFRVTAEAENPDRRLKPGMSVDLVIQVARESGVVLPTNAVRREQDHSYVELVENADSTVKREVTTGLDNGVEIVILAGLDPGETVTLPESRGELPWQSSDAPTAQAEGEDREALPISVPGSSGPGAGSGSGGGAGGGAGR